MDSGVPEFSLELALLAAVTAGHSVMKIYNSGDFDIRIKSDQSPITTADKHANQTIHDVLFKTGLPVLSEEDCDIQYALRSKWKSFWMVDPLDGTKEFINRSGDFTINIALIHNQQPIMGVIYVPVSGELYFANRGEGAFKTIIHPEAVHTSFSEIVQSASPIKVRKPAGKLTIVASKSHGSEETNYFVRKHYANELGEYISRGSSLKLCLIAEGKAEIYPRFAGTMEWDIAAGHAILNEAGGAIVLTDGFSPIAYNKKDLLNPYFIAVSSRSLIKEW